MRWLRLKDLGQRSGERARPGPPLVERPGSQRHRLSADADVRETGAAEQLLQPVRVLKSEGPGDTRGRDRGPDLLRDRVEDESQPRILLTRSPDGDREASARPQDAVDLARRPARVRREHQALATEDDVE